jgi:hypothetical protein
MFKLTDNSAGISHESGGEEFQICFDSASGRKDIAALWDIDLKMHVFLGYNSYSQWSPSSSL